MLCLLLMHFYSSNTERNVTCLAFTPQSAPVFSPLLQLTLLSVQIVSFFSFPPLPYVFLFAFQLPVKTGERGNKNIKSLN